MRTSHLTTLLTGLVVVLGGVSSAQEPAAPAPVLRLAVDEFPPCVIKQQNGFSGFDMELWREVASALGVKTEYVEIPFKDLLRAVAEGGADAGMAGISITEERERSLDFSYPYLDSGLCILVPTERSSTWRVARDALLDRAVLRALLSLLVFIVIAGHVVWLAERGRDAIKDQYFPGIFEAVWCVIATMTTVGYGDIVPRRWLGRVVAFLVMLIGISFFGFVVAQLSAGLAVHAVTAEIGSQFDLAGRRVATVEDTTSVSVLRQLGAEVLETRSLQEACAALREGRAEAVVFDAPTVRHMTAHQTTAEFEIVGPVFQPQAYGIAFPTASPWREPVNRVLLKLRETGAYEDLRRKWFGND